MADPGFKHGEAKPADPVLKVVPPAPAVVSKSQALGVFRQYRRFILLVAIPLAAAIVGLTVYLLGGRYITAEDVGTNVQDMEWIRMETKFVTGVAGRGGSGEDTCIPIHRDHDSLRSHCTKRRSSLWAVDSR